MGQLGQFSDLLMGDSYMTHICDEMIIHTDKFGLAGRTRPVISCVNVFSERRDEELFSGPGEPLSHHRLTERPAEPAVWSRSPGTQRGALVRPLSEAGRMERN